MAYTLLLQTADSETLTPGKIRFDRATGKYVGSILPCAGKADLEFIGIEIGKSLKFVKKTATGEIVSFDFRPDPETPKFPENLRDCLTWWVGESFEEGCIAAARCVLCLSPSSFHETAPKSPVRTAVARAQPPVIASHATP